MTGNFPKNYFPQCLLFVLALILFAAHETVAQQTTQDFNAATAAWKPPAPRLNVKTPFAPHPTKGNNIFKGEAETWLADAIVEIETEGLIPISDKSIAEYVSKVGQNLVPYSFAPTKKYEFIVVQSSDIRSMTAGGGRIYITLGILRQLKNEDELACVLAHELAHDAFAHVPKTVTRQMFWMIGVKKVSSAQETKDALEKLNEKYRQAPVAAVGEALLGFARNNELEADRAAFYTAYKAGYNPRALPVALKRIEREIRAEEEKNVLNDFLWLLLGNHPPTSQRALTNSLESIWVKMPPKDERYKSTAFDAMKAYLLVI